jgi:O-antigen/teichoic acid export membrane protein
MARPIIRTLPSLFIWQVVTVVAGFVTQIVLARSLGPTNKGILDLFLLIPFVTSSVVEMGLLSANTYHGGKGTFSFQTLHSNSIVWSIGVGMLVFIVGVIISVVIGSPFAVLSNKYFLLALAVVPASLYFLLWSGLMYGGDQVKMVYLIGGLYSLISLVVYGVVVLVGGTLEMFVYVSAALLLTRACLSLLSTRKTAAFRLDFNVTALKQSLLYGLALYVGLAINALHFRINQFFIEAMLGPTALGYFALAVRIAEMLWLLDYVVVTASLYRVTSEDFKGAVLVAQRSVKLVAVLVIIPSVAIFALAPLLVPLFFGRAFAPAVLPLWYLLPGVVAWSLGRSLSPFISYQYGKPWYNTAAAGFAFVINLGANFILIPKLGTVGASIASTVSYTVNLVIIGLIFFRLTHANFLETFLPTAAEISLVRQLIRERYNQIVKRFA